MRLVKVTPELFESIQSNWNEQCKKYDEVIEVYAAPSMAHAEKIVNDGANGQDYSIFAANIEGEHACILHVNRARLPGTSGVTQKVMWVLLSPHYDYEDVGPDEIARVATAVIYGAIELCKEEGRSDHVKIHIGNIADREFFSGVAFALKEARELREVEIRGKWLHMSLA